MTLIELVMIIMIITVIILLVLVYIENFEENQEVQNVELDQFFEILEVAGVFLGSIVLFFITIAGTYYLIRHIKDRKIKKAEYIKEQIKIKENLIKMEEEKNKLLILNKVRESPFREQANKIVNHIDKILSSNLTNNFPGKKQDLIKIKNEYIFTIIDNYSCFKPKNENEKHVLFNKSIEQLDLLSETVDNIEKHLIEQQNYKINVNKRFLKQKFINE